MSNKCISCAHYIKAQELPAGQSTASVCQKLGLINVDPTFFCAAHKMLDNTQIKILNPFPVDYKAIFIHENEANPLKGKYEDFSLQSNVTEFEIPAGCTMIIPVPAQVRYRVRAFPKGDSFSFFEMNGNSGMLGQTVVIREATETEIV